MPSPHQTDGRPRHPRLLPSDTAIRRRIPVPMRSRCSPGLPTRRSLGQRPQGPSAAGRGCGGGHPACRIGLNWRCNRFCPGHDVFAGLVFGDARAFSQPAVTDAASVLADADGEEVARHAAQGGGGFLPIRGFGALIPAKGAFRPAASGTKRQRAQSGAEPGRRRPARTSPGGTGGLPGRPLFQHQVPAAGEAS